MFRVPKDLDLSMVVGKTTTQLHVGQNDLQFTFDSGTHTAGAAKFLVTSSVDLFRAGKLVAHWEEGKWPDPGFFDIMNTEVVRWEVPNDGVIVLEFANGIEMHLEDNSDHYESIEIWFEGNPVPVII
jgi:hypothetical protein